jgi:hypothetical protein
MPSRLIVVLVLLLLATTAVIVWLCLAILSAREATLCPEECRCDTVGHYVTCYGPSLTAVPVIRNTNVRVLELSENNITLFGRDSFVSLTELEGLFVFRCGLRTIELGAFNGLTKLTRLLIAGNEISEIIPGTFENMDSLEYLDLKYNRLERLDVGVFGGLVNLKYIDLAENELQYLHPDTFLGLPNIQNVSLYGNRGLQVPTDRHFFQSHSLSQLLMSDCNVNSVSVETYAKVSALERLDLRYNKLRTVDINILRALPKLSALYLHGNRLQCDCQLQELWRWCEDRNIQTVYNGTASQCDTPSDVEGKWLGVLEKGRCLEGNVEYCGDYKNTSYSHTDIDNTYTDTRTDTDKEFETDTNMDTETDRTRKQRRTWTLKSRRTGTQTNTQRRKVTKLPERRRRQIKLRKRRGQEKDKPVRRRLDDPSRKKERKIKGQRKR